MSSIADGSVISFPDFADIRVIRSTDTFKRGHVDFHGCFECTPNAGINSLRSFGGDHVTMMIYFAVTVMDGASFTLAQSSDEKILLTDKADSALSYMAFLVCPVNFTATEYRIFSVPKTGNQPQVTKRTHHDVVDTWSTSEIKFNGRISGNEQWVRYEDYARKINEYQLLLAKDT